MTIYNSKLRHQMMADAKAQAQSLGHALTHFYRQETLEDNTLCRSAPEHRLLAVCEKCGCPVELPTGNHEALYLACEPDAQTAAEGVAELVSLAPQLLYDRLSEAAQSLPEDIALFFDPGQLDTERFCLLSNDGIWCLKFLLRRAPQEPIGPNNPQSDRGRVELHRWVSERALVPVTYVGPELNPNISKDGRRQRVRILYPGEKGIAHRLPSPGSRYDDDLWLFRRLDGTRGYTLPAHFLEFHKPEARLTGAIEEKLRALRTANPNYNNIPGYVEPLFVHEPAPVGAGPA